MEIDGVVKLFPVPKNVPPETAEYQFKVPELAIAAKSTVPVPHLDPGVVVVITGETKIVSITVAHVIGDNLSHN